MRNITDLGSFAVKNDGSEDFKKFVLEPLNEVRENNKAQLCLGRPDYHYGILNEQRLIGYYWDKDETPNVPILSVQQVKDYLLSGVRPGEEKNTKVVCYCGSLRVAMEAFKKAEYDAVLKGEIALLPCCMFVDIEREYGAESDYKQKADELHKRKIDICDGVFILNVGGYIGESTRNEIEYANKIGKPIKYLEPLTP